MRQSRRGNFPGQRVERTGAGFKRQETSRDWSSMNGGARRRLASSPTAFTALPDGFSDTCICLPPPAGSTLFRARINTKRPSLATKCRPRDKGEDVGQAIAQSRCKGRHAPPLPRHSGPCAHAPGPCPGPARKVAYRMANGGRHTDIPPHPGHAGSLNAKFFPAENTYRQPPSNAGKCARDGSLWSRRAKPGLMHSTTARRAGLAHARAPDNAILFFTTRS